MLQGMYIKNFRGIREGSISGMGQVNLFLGPNGCGKSTVLESLYLASGAIHFGDVLLQNKIQSIRNGRIEDQDQFPNSWHFNHKEENKIEFVLDFGDENRIHVELGSGRDGFKYFPADKKKSPVVEASIKWLENVFLAKYDVLLGKNIVENALFDKVLSDRMDKEIVDIISDVYEINIEALSYSKNKLMALLPEKGLRIDDLGSGMRMTIRLLLLAVSMQNTALLIEEFDAYQNRDSLNRIAMSIVRIAKKNTLQLFLTTHNIDSVRAFLEAAKEIGIDGFKSFPLKIHDGGLLDTKPIGIAETENLLDIGFDVRSLGSNE